MKARITYRPGHSPLHRLHPLVKGSWLLWGSVAVFAIHSPWFIAGLLLCLLMAFRLSRLSLSSVRGTRIFLVTGLVLGGLQCIFVKTGPPWLTLGALNLTADGVAAGVYVAGRFWNIILMSYLFVFTTDPNTLAYALMKAGVPYRYGFTLITALRLIPLFEEEGRIVYEAQLTRGMRYDTRSPRRFLELLRQYFMPLLVSALSKVDALAVSMEGRCFGKYPQRTFLREITMTPQDYAALGFLGLCTLSLGLTIL